MKKTDLTELRRRLRGRIITDQSVRDYFATDGSIFTATPELVIYPEDAADIQGLLAYLTERAEARKPLATVTARGRGSDQTGAAITSGIQLILPVHLGRLTRLDKTTVTVEPGMVYRTLEELLRSHGRTLPPYPSSWDFATIGGAIANDAAGEKSVRYGSIGRYVRRLSVVLADGQVIETKRLSARELSRKKGQSNLEGAIYRTVDGLLIDNAKLLAKTTPKTTKNTSGYNVWDVRRRDGSFDLSPLIVGSQGTLGIVTEATLATAPYNPKTSLVVGYFDDLAKAGEAIRRTNVLEPSAFELIDHHLTELIEAGQPSLLQGLLPERKPRLVLLAEFDERSQLRQTYKARRALRLFNHYGREARLSTDPREQTSLWQLRHAAAYVMTTSQGAKKALPFIEDGAVPVGKLPQLLEKTYKLLRQHDVDAAVWGHAGDANLHIQPFLDLSKPKDVDKLYAIADAYAEVVLGLGGTLSAEHGDGLLRGPYLERQFGNELFDIFRAIKTAFDPHGLLNPDKKTGADVAVARQLLRGEYHLPHLYDHLPH